MSEKRKNDFLSFSAIFISVAILFSISSIFYSSEAPRRILHPAEAKQNITVVIDAGHGGEDGGACTYGGLPEKELNLFIASELYDMLSFAGIDAVMTRTEDILLYDPNSDHKGHKKSMDLAERLKIAKSTPGAILISIHMNAFPEEKYCGLQVYYSSNSSQSSRLAELIQSNTKKWLTPSNNRNIKPAGKNIYLLDRFEGTAILIECGFLSNTAERDLLNSESYRTELAKVFFFSVIQYISEGGT